MRTILLLIFLAVVCACNDDGNSVGDGDGPEECCVHCLDYQKACGDGCIPEDLNCNVDCGCSCDFGESRPRCEGG